jgi:hypothetical protein
MRLQIDDIALDFDAKQHNLVKPLDQEHTEDIVIAGAISEWVLTGLQWWRKVAPHSKSSRS